MILGNIEYWLRLQVGNALFVVELHTWYLTVSSQSSVFSACFVCDTQHKDISQNLSAALSSWFVGSVVKTVENLGNSTDLQNRFELGRFKLWRFRLFAIEVLFHTLSPGNVQSNSLLLTHIKYSLILDVFQTKLLKNFKSLLPSNDTRTHFNELNFVSDLILLFFHSK